MNALFDYGELLICIAPVFFVIAAIGLVLLRNSWPTKERDDKGIKGDNE